MPQTRAPLFDPADIHLDPKNARGHSPENIAAIKASLVRFGQQKPIVITKDRIVKAGNGTLIAVRELGWSEIWCKITELTDEEADLYAIADNRSSELAFWDNETLLSGLTNMAAVAPDLFEGLGFTGDDVLEPDLDALDVDVEGLDLGEKDFLAEAVILLQITIPQSENGVSPAQREIERICTKFGLNLESKVQLR